MYLRLIILISAICVALCAYPQHFKSLGESQTTPEKQEQPPSRQQLLEELMRQHGPAQPAASPAHPAPPFSGVQPPKEAQPLPPALPAPLDSAEFTPRSIEQLMADFAWIHADPSEPQLSERPLIFPGLHIYPSPDFASSPLRIPFSSPLWSEERATVFGGEAPEVPGWHPALPLPSPGSRSWDLSSQLLYDYMITHPAAVHYLAWTLPEPPKLIETRDDPEEFLIADVMIPQEIPETPAPAQLDIIRRTNWLHKVDGSVQFSQAYLSPNWYQGGNNNLSLLVGFLWNVKLNEVYHPSVLFESNLSYKLGLYSTPQDQVHDYSVSEDLFQYNLKFGLRAKNNWFYSLSAQFKTQLLNNYAENSEVRKSAFMSPGELNLGLGMTYSAKALKNRLKFNLSVAPLSYNLKTCLDTHVDPTQFSIEAGRKTLSQFGSSAEGVMEWSMTSNISWRSRLFLFSNYDDFQGDWENTFNFSINRFLSTQIYVHLRYDTSTEASPTRWRHWMLKEILSFGFRYAFSSK